MSEPGEFRRSPTVRNSRTREQRQRAVRRTADRSMNEAVKKNVAPSDLVPDKIVVTNTHVVVLLGDVSGSMGDDITEIYSRLRWFPHNVPQYFGDDDVAYLFGAIGDAEKGDDYAVQIQPPVIKGIGSSEALEKLIHEKGGGGGDGCESHGIPALWLARNFQAPSAKKLICVFCTDEQPRRSIDRTMAKRFAHVNLKPRSIETADVFAELKKQGWSTYCVRRHYNCPSFAADHEIEAHWDSLLGRDHVTAPLTTGKRIVDVIYGILAREMGDLSLWWADMLDRQVVRDDKDQIVSVEWDKIKEAQQALIRIDSRFAQMPKRACSPAGCDVPKWVQKAADKKAEEEPGQSMLNEGLDDDDELEPLI